jgi:HemX protein
MGRLPLILSSACFLVGFGYTMFSLGAGRYRPSRLNFSAMLCGFLLQTLFLSQRGRAMSHCPITNQFEVFIFLCWSMVLLYLLIGPAYRLTLLGAFTAPLVFLLQTFALLAPIDVHDTPVKAPNPWLELHAALSIISYGAFALACVAGVMFLAQDHQIKTRKLGTLFFQLPPVTHLAVAIKRLLLAGVALLAAGLAAGFMVGSPVAKTGIGIVVWVLYALILGVAQVRQMSPRRMALLAVLAFTVTLASLWGMHISGGGI